MSTALLPSASIASTPGVLSTIRDAACNLSIWQRDNLEGLDALLDSSPSDIRLTAKLEGLGANLFAALKAHGFTARKTSERLVADILQLADLYCKAMGLDALEVRLEVVTTNSCRKWHSDYVSARLITTYVGSGTQWLDGVDAQRVKQGQDPLHINTMSTGDVGLFKGKLATTLPAIHRSPPIYGTGETRLLLVFNPPEANADADI
ncbi:MAG: DUF1826 domain-containing protein [Erythrobacter sp.]